jgi:hypothetical protein
MKYNIFFNASLKNNKQYRYTIDIVDIDLSEINGRKNEY